MPALTYPRFGFEPLGQSLGYFTPAVMAVMAKAKVVQFGFWPGWGTVSQMNSVVDPLVAAGVFVQQYIIMSEQHISDTASADIRSKLDTMNWWCRRISGQQAAWSSSFSSWDTNPTDTTTADGNGDRLPQWLAKRWKTTLNGVNINGIKIDNTFCRPRTLYYNTSTDNTNNFALIGTSSIENTSVDINWLNDGVARDNRDPMAGQKFRAGNLALAESLRTQFSNIPGFEVCGNMDSSASALEYCGKFNSLEMEGLVWKSYGLYQQIDSAAAMHRYMNCQRNVRNPERNVIIDTTAGQAQMRHALCFTSMGDGVYIGPMPAATLPDEFSIDLGVAVDPPQYKATMDSIWMRRFQNGIVLCNLKNANATITGLPARLKRIDGVNDSAVNNGAILNGGAAGGSVTLAANTSLILMYY